MPFMFENLQVYQKSVDLADRIAALTQNFPRGYYFLTDQLNRAVVSIATNLAEGNGRFTKADRRNFFTIARGSVQECVPLLEISRRSLTPIMTLSRTTSKKFPECSPASLPAWTNGRDREKPARQMKGAFSIINCDPLRPLLHFCLLHFQ